MNESKPNFIATITVTRGRAQDPHKGSFVFGDNCSCRVLMEMDGVDGLNTVGIQVGAPSIFPSGSSFTGRCRALWEKPFRDKIAVGTKFRFWDGGYFAEGVVNDVQWENWEPEPEVVCTQALETNDTGERIGKYTLWVLLVLMILPNIIVAIQTRMMGGSLGIFQDFIIQYGILSFWSSLVGQNFDSGLFWGFAVGIPLILYGAFFCGLLFWQASTARLFCIASVIANWILLSVSFWTFLLWSKFPG